MSIARDWCFTLNNPKLKHFDKLLELWEGGALKYLVFQLEEGEQGTEHFQGFLQLEQKQRLSYLKKRISKKVHVEQRRGTPREAADYCKKQETRVGFGPFECGELSFSGQRTDCEQLVRDAKAGMSMSDLTEVHSALCVRNLGNIQKIRSMFIPARDFKTKVVILWGEPRVGKTYYAFHSFPTPYLMNDYDNQLFFADYDPLLHETVIFDEFYGGIKFHKTKQLMDAYPFLVQTKGGFVPFRPKWIVFTSNDGPLSWYKAFSEPQHLKAFFERVEFEAFFDATHYWMKKGDDLPFPPQRQKKLQEILQQPNCN